MTPALEQLVARAAEAYRVEVEAVLRLGRSGRSRRASSAAAAVMWAVHAAWKPRPSYEEIAVMLGRSHPSTSRQAIAVMARHVERGDDVGKLALRLLRPASVPPPRLRVA